jgi:thioredoxin reductase
MNSNNISSSYDYIVIGAGPAGLQLGYFLQQAGRNYLIIEAGSSAGTFFKTFPRHRTLISSNKVYTGFDDREINLRWDWNSLLSDSDEMLFKHYSKNYFPAADDMARYLADFAARFDLKIKYGVRVIQITKGAEFELTDDRGEVYRCRRLIVATGVTRSNIPPIEGIELAERYTDVSVEPEEFTNQRVLIIGKGNSGFETAENLIETAAVIHVASPNPLQMSWRTHFVGHLRAVNNNFLDTYQLKSQNAVLDATVDKIERVDGKFKVSFSYTHANGEREELLYDRVIVCAGFRFDATIFDDTCRPALTINDRFPSLTSEWESTTVKDLYFAGTLMQVRDYRKTTSGFIHGFRYNVRALHRMFGKKYHGEEWPGTTIKLDPKVLMAAAIERVNKSSGLWQQFGFLGDLIVVDEAQWLATYYEDVPMDYIKDGKCGDLDDYYTVTLEYGPEYAFADPFNITRIERNDVNRSEQSNFLHPIVRRFSRGKLIADHHIIEDLAAQWNEDVHLQPLLRFFKNQLEAEQPKVQAATPNLARACSLS